MEWKEYNICQLCDTISETYKGKSNSVVLINTSDVLEGKVLNHKRVPNKGLKGQFKKTFKKNDILYSEIRPANKRFAYINFSPNDYIASTKLMVLRSKPIVSSYFLFQILKSEIVLKNLQMLAESRSGTFPQITYSELSNVRVKVPPLPVQDKIVGILSALDSKIENNNKINANLEVQAEALFKSWFVDFTPFKDQPFVDSELGPIPQGWKVGKLGDLGDIVGGSTPSKSKPEYYTTHGIAWLTPKDLSTSKAKFTSRGEIDITDEGYNSTSTKLMPRGSVLFSSRAPIGYLTIAKNEICTNQGFKSLVPNGAGTGFIYYSLRHLTPQIENRATGSTFKEASATLMRSVETIVPPTSILNKFEELLRPILQFQEKKEEENQRLAALRDTLLPKLMSGEIKL